MVIFFCIGDKRRGIQIPLFMQAIIGPPSKRHYGPTLLKAGLAALWFFRVSDPVLPRNPIFLWFFLVWGGRSGPHVPPLDPYMMAAFHWTTSETYRWAGIQNYLQVGKCACVQRRFIHSIRKIWSEPNIGLLGTPESAHRSLCSDCADVQAGLSLRWAHMTTCTRGVQYVMKTHT